MKSFIKKCITMSLVINNRDISVYLLLIFVTFDEKYAEKLCITEYNIFKLNCQKIKHTE